MKERIGIWNRKELDRINSLVSKAKELDEQENLGRVFLSRMVAAFYSYKKAIRILDAITNGSAEVIQEAYDVLIDDILEVENYLSLVGNESLDELWKIADAIGKIAGVKVEKIIFNDEAFNRVYVMGRIAFIIYKLKKKKQEIKTTLLPHRGRKVTYQQKDVGMEYSKIATCRTCRYKPMEVSEHHKKCSHCEPVGVDRVGSNWEPMSFVEQAEKLAYYNEEVDMTNPFEETVVDGLLQMMEHYGGYLPPLINEEFWAMSPELEKE